MNDPIHTPRDDLSQNDVDRAIAAVLSEPAPREALERTIQAAQAWDVPSEGSAAARGGVRRWAIAAGIAAAIGFFILLQTPRLTDRGTPPSPVAAALPEVSEPPRPADGSPRPAQSFYLPHPITEPVVADAAPIIVVTAGPARPVKLGEQIPHKEFGVELAERAARLHIWDWSASDLSRVLVTPQIQRGTALAPDGRLLLSTSGEAIDIASGETRQFNGFSVDQAQRIDDLWFSPTGRYVAARIHLRTNTKQIQRQPRLLSSQHAWSLRVIDLEAGKIVSEFPAAGLSAPCFMPDETAIIHARPSGQEVREEVVVLRDLRSAETVREYEARDAGRLREAVGIAASPDGRFVAAGFYYGDLLIWEAASGSAILHHRFLRGDGTRDTFFQAKLLRFSSDGELLAMVSGNRLKVLETRAGNVQAQYYDAATPSIVHLRWSPDAERITFVTRSTIGDFAPDSGFPPSPRADVLPQVYEWPWKKGAPALKEFP